LRVIYVSGPYSNKDWEGISVNILKARDVAIKLWKEGWAVICPHCNTAHFDTHIKDRSVFIRGDLEILRRCDAIFMLKGYKQSFGARCELRLAKCLGLEVIYARD